jgi:hypothetical protein
LKRKRTRNKEGEEINKERNGFTRAEREEEQRNEREKYEIK